MATASWPIPTPVFGTDSHTTMVNGLGVLGWGVGGIEAEAAMLGQPISMLIPEVVGFRACRPRCAEGATATDLVLTVTEMLRKHGVVGKFVEFFGAGLDELAARRSRHHRQHGTGIRRYLRLLPDRPRSPSTICASPRAASEHIDAGRTLCQGAGHCGATPGCRRPHSAVSFASTSAPSSRRLAGPTPAAGPGAAREGDGKLRRRPERLRREARTRRPEGAKLDGSDLELRARRMW